MNISKVEWAIIVTKLNRILMEVGNMALDISALQAAVAAETTLEASVETLLSGLAAQLAALEPTQEAIDALTKQVNDNIANLKTAVTANTPVAPPTPAP